ncbi:MAG: tetratricopeptide repeat protein [Planctomycetota bacterium]|jgi:tetratricopeptide (TPR) repeat protein
MNRSKRNNVLPAACVALFAMALYIRSLWGTFLEFDDQFFILTDRVIRSLDFSSLKQIFTEGYFANFHPITRLSYAVDHALFGFHGAAFHAHSLILYGLGCSLVFVFLRTLLKSFWPALVAALLFAAHTTHVEVVAWLSARKDLYCLLFGVLGLYCYILLRERERFSWGLYILVIFLSLLAGWSKSLAVVLPALFIALDLAWYRRLKGKEALQLLPVIVVMAYIAWKNYDAQAGAGAVKHVWPAFETFGMIALNYIWKTVLPFHLSARYVIDPDAVSMVLALLGIVLFAGLLALGIHLFFKGRRLVPLAVAWFVIPLAPVSNLIPISTPMADRYLFWPSLGWCILVGGWLVWVMQKERARPAYALCIALLLFMSVSTVMRNEAWLDDESLWKDALAENPDNYVALTSLGEQALKRGNVADAQRYLGAAVHKCKGSYSSAYLSYGQVLYRSGKTEEALEHFKQAFDMGGEQGWLAHRAAYDVGLMLQELGRGKEAIAWFEKALDLAVKTQESRVEIFIGLGNVHYAAKAFDKAEAAYRKACADSPGDPRPRFYLGLTLHMLDRFNEAEEAYEKALALKDLPAKVSFDYGDIHLMLGKLFQENLGKPDLALFHFRKVLEINPNHPQRQALEAIIKQ